MDKYGDGNTYRGVSTRDSGIPTYTDTMCRCAEKDEEIRRLREQLEQKKLSETWDCTKCHWVDNCTEVKRLRDALEFYAKYIVRRYDGKKDHACIECVPDGTAIIDGFKCAYHRAQALTAGEGE